MKRREMMSEGYRALNVGAFLTLGGFVGSLGITSMASGHPMAAVCYECRACYPECPLKLDPASFMLSARTRNPDRYMLAGTEISRTDADGKERLSNGDVTFTELVGDDEPELTVEYLQKIDPYMQVMAQRPGGEPERMYVGDVASDMKLLSIYKMRAKDAAQLCTLCGMCAKNCPIDINITEVPLHLKIAGGTFEAPPEQVVVNMKVAGGE